jgi:hypothetical protein
VLRIVCAIAMAILAATTTVNGPAAAQSPAPDDAGYCTVQVARVAPADASGATQAVVVMPTVDGSATLSGTIALFTADDLRYDVPFPDTRITSNGAPTVLLYRFANPVTITGAYVSALGGPAPGPCAPAFPWSKSAPHAAKAVDHAMASVPSDAKTIAVTGSGSPDPLRCAVPYQAAHTITAAAAPVIDAREQVTVHLTLRPDGKPTDATIAKVVYLDTYPTGRTDALRAAIQTAAASTFESEIFRCRHVVGTYDFNVEYQGSPRAL